MQSFREFIGESSGFSNWVRPSDTDLTQEYKIEYQIKPLKRFTNDAFPELKDFLAAAKAAKVVSLTKSMDRKIEYRSHTKNKEALLTLIRSYRSYPKFRNEKTIDAIYQGFEDNKKMTMPVVLDMPDGEWRIMGGNTRLDIAFHVGATPKVLLIKVPKR